MFSHTMCCKPAKVARRVLASQPTQIRIMIWIVHIYWNSTERENILAHADIAVCGIELCGQQERCEQCEKTDSGSSTDRSDKAIGTYSTYSTYNAKAWTTQAVIRMRVVEISTTAPIWRQRLSAGSRPRREWCTFCRERQKNGRKTKKKAKVQSFAGHIDDVDNNDGTAYVNSAMYQKTAHYIESMVDKTGACVADFHGLDSTNSTNDANNTNRVNIVVSVVSSKETDQANVTDGTNSVNGENKMLTVRIKQ